LNATSKQHRLKEKTDFLISIKWKQKSGITGVTPLS
jgi:hypothetical protein